MRIEIVSLQKSHMTDVIRLLQGLSVFEPAETDHARIWEEFTAQTNIVSLVALADGAVAGYGAMVIETKIRGGRMGHIEDIVTHPDVRGAGLGRAILDGLKAVAAIRGCYKLALQCRDDKVEFYRKCGYETSGVAMQMFLKVPNK